ncbi:MAG TPA: hypothetical protein VIL30_17105 [Ramlibacter sp.]|jgi:hypothetical protein
MATLSVVRWREDAVGFTGWDGHLKSELKKRLKRAIDASPEAVRAAARDIHARQLVTLEGIKSEEIARVCQILETMGAEVSVTMGDGR